MEATIQNETNPIEDAKKLLIEAQQKEKDEATFKVNNLLKELGYEYDVKMIIGSHGAIPVIDLVKTRKA